MVGGKPILDSLVDKDNREEAANGSPCRCSKHYVKGGYWKFFPVVFCKICSLCRLKKSIDHVDPWGWQKTLGIIPSKPGGRDTCGQIISGDINHLISIGYMNGFRHDIFHDSGEGDFLGS